MSAPVRRVTALACLLLAACGGGGGGGADGGRGTGGGQQSADYFPLPANARWIYAADDGSTERVDVIGTVSTAQGTGSTLATTDSSGGLLDRSIAYADSTNVTVYPSGDVDNFDPQAGPLKLLSFPASAGQSFTQVEKTFTDFDVDQDGKPDQLSVKAVATVVGYEDVDVPAGRITQALHVSSETIKTAVLSSSGRTQIYRSVEDDWYGAGIGLVRSTATHYLNGVAYGATTSHSLTAFRVGVARSETTPPTIASTTPDGTARASGTDVSIKFSEAIDVDTLAPGWRITDSDGNLLSGHVTMSGNTAHFVPDVAWQNGTYTATLTTAVTDLVGNSLAQTATWHFTLDGVAPSVLSSTPASAASDVVTTSPVVIQFSEPIDPASVALGNTLYVNDGVNAIPVTTQVTGATLTITPTQGWQRQKTIQVSLGGVKDVSGNPMVQTFVLSFRSDSGQFGYPQDLTTSGTQAVAIVDLDSDGRNDFVYAVPAPDLPSAYVRYGRADGTLEDAVPLVSSDLTSCSQNGSITVVDLDGDGRNDVVVGGGWCGWHVLRQNTARSFVLAEQPNYVTWGALQVADLDGDGQLEVIGLSTNSAELMVWHQDGTQRFATVPTRIALPDATGWLLRITDLDGDGRPDLVVAGMGSMLADVVIYRQQPDGSFVQSQTLMTGEGNAKGLAIGDTDGDGRPDLVVTAGGNSPVYVAVFRQLADHSFAAPQHLPCLDIPSAVTLADLNGDGRLDVVVTHAGWGHVGTFMQLPDGTLTAEALFVTGYGSGSQSQLAVGDLTGDGKPDLVVDGQLLRQRMPDSGPPAPLRMSVLAHPALTLHRASSLRHASGGVR